MIWFLLSGGLLSFKRVVLRRGLRYFRQKGYNQKHVLLIGGGEMARIYWETVRGDRELGYTVAGYVSARPWKELGALKWFGGYEKLDRLLDRLKEEYGYSELDAFLILKDILAAVWKQRKQQGKR